MHGGRGEGQQYRRPSCGLASAVFAVGPQIVAGIDTFVPEAASVAVPCSGQKTTAKLELIDTLSPVSTQGSSTRDWSFRTVSRTVMPRCSTSEASQLGADAVQWRLGGRVSPRHGARKKNVVVQIGDQRAAGTCTPPCRPLGLVAPDCTNKVKDTPLGETGIDCGGPDCGRICP